MDVTPLIPAGRQVIESYGGGRFTVSGKIIEGSAIIFPDQVAPWGITAIEDLTIAAFAAITDLPPDHRPEVLLLGCGPKMSLIPSALRQALRAYSIILEPMDTGAACRTYNVLLAEGRRVTAALIAVE